MAISRTKSIKFKYFHYACRRASRFLETFHSYRFASHRKWCRRTPKQDKHTSGVRVYHAQAHIHTHTNNDRSDDRRTETKNNFGFCIWATKEAWDEAAENSNSSMFHVLNRSQYFWMATHAETEWFIHWMIDCTWSVHTSVWLISLLVSDQTILFCMTPTYSTRKQRLMTWWRNGKWTHTTHIRSLTQFIYTHTHMEKKTLNNHIALHFRNITNILFMFATRKEKKLLALSWMNQTWLATIKMHCNRSKLLHSLSHLPIRSSTHTHRRHTRICCDKPEICFVLCSTISCSFFCHVSFVLFTCHCSFELFRVVIVWASVAVALLQRLRLYQPIQFTAKNTWSNSCDSSVLFGVCVCVCVNKAVFNLVSFCGFQCCWNR